MPKGNMWENKCANCDHSQARHKKWLVIMWGVNGILALFGAIILRIIININFTEGLIIITGFWILLNQLKKFGFSEQEGTKE